MMHPCNHVVVRALLVLLLAFFDIVAGPTRRTYSRIHTYKGYFLLGPSRGTQMRRLYQDETCRIPVEGCIFGPKIQRLVQRLVAFSHDEV